MYQYVLFDLDGTLTDPKEGITKSVQYALHAFGIEEPDINKLEPFIGPPLRDSFRDFYGIDGEDTNKAVAKFRERFEVTGINENHIYPGMKDMLERLHKQGILLAIASSKPQEFVHIVLKNFEIEQYFDIIVGSEKDGTRDTKIEVMEEALSQIKKKVGRKYSNEKVLMVGDRKFDVEGAKNSGVSSAAVTYGYAPEGELAAANPDRMADSVQELEEIITGQKSYMGYKDKSSFAKTVEILIPFLVYWVIELVAYNGLYFLISHFAMPADNMKAPLSVILNAFAAIATWPFLSRQYQISHIDDTSHVVTRRKNRKLKREFPLIIAYSVALAVGLNFLVTFMRIISVSESYQSVANTQYSVSIPVGLVVYGLLTPFTEELMFRGVLYNRIKKYFPVSIAIFLSSLVFGCYHGNLIQMLYAAIMGIAMAFIYEYYGTLTAPVLFHCSANTVIYVMSKGNSFMPGKAAIWYVILFIFMAVCISCWYFIQWKRKITIYK